MVQPMRLLIIQLLYVRAGSGGGDKYGIFMQAKMVVPGPVKATRVFAGGQTELPGSVTCRLIDLCQARFVY